MGFSYDCGRALPLQPTSSIQTHLPGWSKKFGEYQDFCSVASESYYCPSFGGLGSLESFLPGRCRSGHKIYDWSLFPRDGWPQSA